MKKMSLKQIIKAVEGFCPSTRDVEIEAVSTDTRNMPQNCLFIALKGENFDGHNFIKAALDNGARAVISSEIYDDDRVIVVDDTEKALGKLAAYYRGLFNPFVVGVTGSVGKTTTKEMIYTILNTNGKTLKTQGNFNNQIGLPMTMFNLDESYENAVIEMGMSDFGEISKLSKIVKPNVAVITNIGISHIETLKTQENIMKAKMEILDGMSVDSPLVLNGDDEFLKNAYLQVENQIIYYGIDNQDSDVYATDIEMKNNQTTFKIHYFGKTIDAKIPTVGRHNVLNSLAGFCVGMIEEIPPEQMVKAMGWYKSADMRQNSIIKNGITTIMDCYNASPASMISAIDVINVMECTGKRICVFGDMLELGEMSEQAHIEVGKEVGRSKVSMLLCYGERAKDIKRGAMVVGMKNVYHFSDKKDLANFIKQNTENGDVIIYKASRGIKLEEVVKMVDEG